MKLGIKSMEEANEKLGSGARPVASLEEQNTCAPCHEAPKWIMCLSSPCKISGGQFHHLASEDGDDDESEDSYWYTDGMKPLIDSDSEDEEDDGEMKEMMKVGDIDRVKERDEEIQTPFTPATNPKRRRPRKWIPLLTGSVGGKKINKPKTQHRSE